MSSDLPNVGRPAMRARSLSCSAPATSSDALAVPAFTSTTIGYRRSERQNERFTRPVSVISGFRPSDVYTTVPRGRNSPAFIRSLSHT